MEQQHKEQHSSSVTINQPTNVGAHWRTIPPTDWGLLNGNVNATVSDIEPPSFVDYTQLQALSGSAIDELKDQQLPHQPGSDMVLSTAPVLDDAETEQSDDGAASFHFEKATPQEDPFDFRFKDKQITVMDWSKELTEDQIGEYYEAFCFFDRDRSGTISTNEIAQVLISIGQATSEVEVREMLSVIDSNDSGSIDFPEFLKVMAQQRRKREFLRDVRQAFRIFDKDGNGFITAIELRQVMTNMLGEKMSDDEVESLIVAADLDGDGQINFDEFVQFMFGYFEENK